MSKRRLRKGKKWKEKSSSPLSVFFTRTIVFIISMCDFLLFNPFRCIYNTSQVTVDKSPLITLKLWATDATQFISQSFQFVRQQRKLQFKSKLVHIGDDVYIEKRHTTHTFKGELHRYYKFHDLNQRELAGWTLRKDFEDPKLVKKLRTVFEMGTMNVSVEWRKLKWFSSGPNSNKVRLFATATTNHQLTNQQSCYIDITHWQRHTHSHTHTLKLKLTFSFTYTCNDLNLFINNQLFLTLVQSTWHHTVSQQPPFSTRLTGSWNAFQGIYCLLCHCQEAHLCGQSHTSVKQAVYHWASKGENSSCIQRKHPVRQGQNGRVAASVIEKSKSTSQTHKHTPYLHLPQVASRKSLSEKAFPCVNSANGI